MTEPDRHTCALRALILCDGHSVVDLTRAPRGRCGCYCRSLEHELIGEQPELAQALRIARARTLARADELGRLVERQARLSAAPVVPF